MCPSRPTRRLAVRSYSQPSSASRREDVTRTSLELLRAGIERTLRAWFSAWNEPDDTTRLKALQSCCSPDIAFRLRRLSAPENGSRGPRRWCGVWRQKLPVKRTVILAPFYRYFAIYEDEMSPCAVLARVCVGSIFPGVLGIEYDDIRLVSVQEQPSIIHP